MAETVGSLIDKICIAELKVFHMREQVERSDALLEHRQKCESRLTLLKQQRTDLVNELNRLIVLWSQRRWKPRIYRQFKMYNDPQYRLKTETVHAPK